MLRTAYCLIRLTNKIGPDSPLFITYTARRPPIIIRHLWWSVKHTLFNGSGERCRCRGEIYHALVRQDPLLTGRDKSRPYRFTSPLFVTPYPIAHITILLYNAVVYYTTHSHAWGNSTTLPVILSVAKNLKM